MEAQGGGLRRVLVLAFYVTGIWSAYIYQGILQETLSTKRFGPDNTPFQNTFAPSLLLEGVSTFALLRTSSKTINKLAHPNARLGYGLCFLNLAFDGFTNATQDSLKASASGYEAVHFCKLHPEAAWDIFLYYCCGTVGQNFIFLTVSRFGSLVNTTITATRKFVSIVVSSLLSGNPLSTKQWGCVSMVFSGLSYQIYLKWHKLKRLQKKKKEPHESHLVLLSSGMQCKTFHGFQISSADVVRLPRFEMVMTKSEANSKPVLAAEDIFTVTVYGRIYCLQVDRVAMLLHSYRLYRDAVIQQGSLPIYSSRIAVSVVDNVLLIHQVDAKVVILYDLFADSRAPQ
ncbi:hypothetical protein KIW84_044642 [Lathyrus oleraceus]|uniref:Uncharacterized protein n=1 Tax=Pisum sativum TaxID=3888 RepID=A0A9D4XL28_PEA|nr:hypothetical protein KIW84_044642 [Pisum sativum]